MSAVFKYEQELQATSCCVCGIQFGVPPYFIDSARRNAGTTYCPNGHSLGWSKSEADRLREQLEKEKASTEWQRARANRLEKDLQSQKGQMTKLKKRISHGVCPCCSRSFANVARHMKTKHPDYTGERE